MFICNQYVVSNRKLDIHSMNKLPLWILQISRYVSRVCPFPFRELNEGAFRQCAAGMRDRSPCQFAIL